MEKNSKIYISGSRGMVGKNLIEKLENLGYKNLIDLPSSELDLTKRDEVFEFFNQERPEYVIHLAARVGGINANIKFPVEFLKDNLLINTNVIDACYQFKVKKLLNLGSSCIYPKNNPQPMKETDLMRSYLEPTNEGYALSKICSLKLCQYYNIEYDTNFISLMPPNLYGKYDKFHTEYSHVISSLLMRIHEAKVTKQAEVIVWGSGNAKREFMYVGDLVEIIIFSMNKIERKDLVDNCFINVGSNEEISIKDLAYLIKKIVKYEGLIKFDESKPEGMKRKLLDSSLFNKIWKKKNLSIEEGIRNSYNYYLDFLKTKK
jgi:GDP-L-fucose synthase